MLTSAPTSRGWRTCTIAFAQIPARIFFRSFPLWFDESEVTLRYYRQIERDLSFIPPSEWNTFAGKVGVVVDRCDRLHRRGWEQLFNVFSEALGARVLVENFGCDTVRLVATRDDKTCDWFRVRVGGAALSGSEDAESFRRQAEELV